jgi:hypothetical protein
MRDELHKDSAVITDLYVKSDSEIALRAALVITFTKYKTVTHFSTGGPVLKLYWATSDKQDIQTLPYALTADNAFDFIYAWLRSVKHQNREHENTHGGDGSDGFGFILAAGDEEHVSTDWRVAFHVKAMNLYYSK